MQHLIRMSALLCLSLTVGCNHAPRRLNTTPQDGLLSQMTGVPISGFWRNDAEGFGGEFKNFVFTPLRTKDGEWRTVGEELVCTISGSGLIWDSSSDKWFEVSGRSVGRKMDLVFTFEDEAIKAIGTVKGGDIWSSSCVVEFVYQGKPRRATLNCVGDISAERQDFKSQVQSQ